MMSIHGKVTDFQMWDEVLPDEQLLKVKTKRLKVKTKRRKAPAFQVTGCEEFPEGNLVSWEKTNWFLNSSRGTVSP